MPWIPFTLQVLVQRPGVVLSDSVQDATAAMQTAML